jgi:hypothetical protein
MPWTRRDLRLDHKPVALGDVRPLGVRNVLVYCSNTACGHSSILDASAWADSVTLGKLQPRMLCKVCDHRGADVRPAWDNWKAAGSRWTVT